MHASTDAQKVVGAGSQEEGGEWVEKLCPWQLAAGRALGCQMLAGRTDCLSSWMWEAVSIYQW